MAGKSIGLADTGYLKKQSFSKVKIEAATQQAVPKPNCVF